MTKLRLLCQWSALAVIIALPMLTRGNAIYEALGAGAHHVSDLTTVWEEILYRGFAYVFGDLSDTAAVASLFHGGYWSLTLFGITFNDPLAALGHMAANRAIHWPLIGGTLFAVGLALVAGRAFCGWICPVNTILELNDRLRRYLEARVTRAKFPKWMPGLRPRWALLLAGLVFSGAAGFNVFILILPYAALARDIHLAVYGAGVGFGIFFMAVLVAVELVAMPRIWCRSLCPTGLLLGWFGRRRAVGITRIPERECLAGCQLCITTCRFGVIPRDQLQVQECVMCNDCVGHCPSDVLKLGVVRPRPKSSKRAAAAVVATLCALGLSADALAHHIKGLPHYGYLENYPQTPTYERQASAPPYQVNVVVFGLDGSGAAIDGMIYLTLKDETTGKPYTGPLAVTIKPIGGGDDGDLKNIKFKAPIEETVYRMRATLVADAYDIVVRIPGAPPTVAHVRIDLERGLNWWVVASAVALVAASGWIGILILRRRRRRRQMTHL